MPRGALTTSPLRRARPLAPPFPPLLVTLQVDVSLGGSTGILESNTACAEASVAAEIVPRPHSVSIQPPSCDQAVRGVGVTSSPSLGREADEPTSGLRVRRRDDKLPSTAYAANDPPMHSSEPVDNETDDIESSRSRPEARAKGEPTWYADWPLLDDSGHLSKGVSLEEETKYRVECDGTQDEWFRPCSQPQRHDDAVPAPPLAAVSSAAPWTAGIQPSVDSAGTQPSVDSAGIQPSVDSAGIQPSVDSAGIQPSVDSAGIQPSVDSAGVQPSVDSAGIQPSVDSAGVPPSCSVVLD
jgi:hypothetical protein